MNERIKQLAEQANIPQFPILGSPAWVATDLDMEKFAELIVRECSKVADESQFKFPNFPVSIAIEEHFGVEL
jgi:hypothetical protein